MSKDQQVQKFRSMWSNPYPYKGLDYSDPFQDLIEEIPPFTKDDKGEWLNDTSVPKFVKKGKINVQEHIQSFADEVDIYKILERFAATGDESLINRNAGFYMDVSDIPNNFNDFQDYLLNNKDKLNLFSDDMRKKILNGDSISDVDLRNEVKSIAKSNYGIDFDDNGQVIEKKINNVEKGENE